MPVAPSDATHNRLQRALGRVGFYDGPLTLQLTEDFVEGIQSHLKHEGAYGGSINGTYDDATAKALQRYLRDIGKYSGAINGTITENIWLDYLDSVRAVNQLVDNPAVDRPNLVNSVAPAITGTAQVGQTLTVSNGTWTGVTPDSFTRQWRKNGVNIAGATGTTYQPVVGDVGAVISCVVTASKDGYDDSTAVSNNTAAVIA